MSSLTSSPAALAFSIAIGLALSGGCALVYHFDDYTGESTSSAASVSAASSGGSGGSGGGSVSASTGSVGSTSSSSGGGGGGGGPHPLTPAWAHSYGTKGADVNGPFGVAVAKGAQKEGVLVAAQFQGVADFGNGPLIPADDAVAVALLDSATGAAVWSYLVASSAGTTVNKPPVIAASPLGQVVVGANFDGRAYLDENHMNYKPTAGGSDIALYVIDVTSSKLVWMGAAGDVGDQIVRAIAIDPNGHIYITGSFVGNFELGGPASPCKLTHDMSTIPEGFLVQLTPDGACSWVTTWSSPASVTGESGLSLAADANGVFLGGTYSGITTIGGNTLMGGVDNEVFVARIETDSTVLSVTPIPGAQDIALTTDSAGSAHFGATVGVGGPTSNFLLGNIAPKGQIPSMFSYTTTGASRLRSIAHAPSGHVFITGWSAGTLGFGPPSQNNGKEDLFLAEFDPMFQPVSVYETGDIHSQFGQSIDIDPMGNVYLGGFFEGILPLGGTSVSAILGTDVFITKFDAASFGP